MNLSGILPFDLAPGDSGSQNFDWSEFEVNRIVSAQDPLFSMAYQKLWDEFGVKGELESQDILERRMKWNPIDTQAQSGKYSLLYEMILVRKNGNFAAVRDHTAIVKGPGDEKSRGRDYSDNKSSADFEAVVHLSHSLIDPSFRRKGMIGWLRAWPIQTARNCLKAVGGKTNANITLVAEMEPMHPDFPDRLPRLKSYGKAGFLKADPRVIQFLQPDFRPCTEIDANGGAKPLALDLVLRRVGLESERQMSGRELVSMVHAIYTMYAKEFRPQDMAIVWDHLKTSYPNQDSSIELVECA